MEEKGRVLRTMDLQVSLPKNPKYKLIMMI